LKVQKNEGIQQTLQREPQSGNSVEEPLMEGKYRCSLLIQTAICLNVNVAI